MYKSFYLHFCLYYDSVDNNVIFNWLIIKIIDDDKDYSTSKVYRSHQRDFTTVPGDCTMKSAHLKHS